MRRDLQTTFYDRNAGIAGDGANPGASVRGRYVAPYMPFMKRGYKDGNKEVVES